MLHIWSLADAWQIQIRPRSKCDVWSVTVTDNGRVREHNTFGVAFTRDFVAHHARYPVQASGCEESLSDEAAFKAYLTHNLMKERRLLNDRLSALVHKIKLGLRPRVGPLELHEGSACLLDTADLTSFD